jgi:dihydrolipoamide dehydrogenase
MPGNSFDLAILGSGPGGYTAAIRASQLGMSVCIIEKKLIGGTCLNIGCIPTKALIHSATVYEESISGRTFGITSSDTVFDWGSIQKYKERCVLKLRKGVESLMKKNRIEVISGHGILKNESAIDVEGTLINSKNIILAVGSYARSLPCLPIDGLKIITSDHALGLEKLPASILIVGAGAIGCEFGYFMSTLGVDVTMVEFLDHALPMEDEEVSVEFEKSLKRKKIKLHTRCSVEGVKLTESGVESIVKPRDSDAEFTLNTEMVLVSVGRGPSTADCGLEEAGIHLERGFIKIDSRMKTGLGSDGQVRAIGDAVGGLMLAHKASAEGIFAVEDIAGKNPTPLVMENIPRATYSIPEVASCGLNENAAREKYGDSVKIGKFPFAACGKAVVTGDSIGFVKLISAGNDGLLVGAHAIGPHATDLIGTASTALSLGATAHNFAQVIQAHPSLSEVWHEASHGLLDGTINF